LPLYSVGTHGDDTAAQIWSQYLDDPTNKVRAVFTGHDHIYARMHNGGPTTYIVSGGAGAPLYPVNAANSKATEVAAVSTYNYVLVHIAADFVHGNAFDAGARLHRDPTPSTRLAPPKLPSARFASRLFVHRIFMCKSVFDGAERRGSCYVLGRCRRRGACSVPPAPLVVVVGTSYYLTSGCRGKTCRSLP
jgi:hypothetical protein